MRPAGPSLAALVLAASLLGACGTAPAPGDPTAGPTGDPAPAVDTVTRPERTAEAAGTPTRTPTPPARALADADADLEADADADADAAAAAGVGVEPAVAARPGWLGTRVLPTLASGFAAAQATPAELDDRRLPPPPSELAPPADDAFAATIAPVPPDVLARSTWGEHCPVAVDDLRYLTVTHRGFDGGDHTGELLVHASVAEDAVEVFRRLHAAAFPLEEVRVIRADELDLAPTGDGNVTTAFVCRDARGGTSWSQHAYGLAIDINPFHNPYLKGSGQTAESALTSGAVVLPELATGYVERDRHRPGMVQPGDVVTTAFADIGWGWGGSWRSLKDWMHFSANGR